MVEPMIVVRQGKCHIKCIRTTRSCLEAGSDKDPNRIHLSQRVECLDPPRPRKKGFSIGKEHESQHNMSLTTAKK